MEVTSCYFRLHSASKANVFKGLFKSVPGRDRFQVSVDLDHAACFIAVITPTDTGINGGTAQIRRNGCQIHDFTVSSSFDSAGQHLTPHSRTLEVRPGRINNKLELHYDYDVKGMILNYYSVSQMYDLVYRCDRIQQCDLATS